MSKMRQAAVAVQIRKPWHDVLQHEHIPPRSRLYSLAPYEIGTIWRESLTGYINRLGWTHHISPRAFAAEMILPHVKTDLGLPLPAAAMFGAHEAMSLNGTGPLASAGVALLKHLTMRADLHLLTLPWWVVIFLAGGNCGKRQPGAPRVWLNGGPKRGLSINLSSGCFILSPSVLATEALWWIDVRVVRSAR